MYKEITRERWLTDACDHFLDTLIMPEVKKKFPRPDVKISIGWMYRSSSAIGQCFRKASSKGAVNEIFIRPDYDDSHRILDILIHELIHAVDDCESGHRRFFRTTALAIGLIGKMTATKAGEGLTETIKAYVDQHGTIPHTALTSKQSTVKKQTTRMLKLECECCGFIARASSKCMDMINTDEAQCPACDTFGALNKV